MDCLFCKIVNREIPGRILYEDEQVLVFLDINQSNLGHTLVIPKKHIKDITEIDNDSLSYLMNIAVKISQEMMGKLGVKGMTYSINYGEAQEIKHLHLHISPYYTTKPPKMDPDKIFELLK